MTRGATVALLFAGLTVVMAAPWSLHPASRVVIDNPDTHLYIWNLGWVVHAFTAAPLRLFDANIFHPLANTLAYSENVIGSALLAAPVLWLTGDPVLALNLVLLTACALCGVGATLLGRRLGLSTGASIIAGVIFAFAPTRFYRMSQLHLNTVQWMPFCLAFAHAYLATGRPWHLRLAIGLFSLQALTSGHAALMLAVGLVVLAAVEAAHGTPLDLGRRCRDVGLAGLALLTPAALLVLPYRRVRTDLGLDRSFELWAATPESFIASPTLVHQWLLSWVTDHDVTATATALLFPGYVVLGLAGVALWRPAAAGALAGGADRQRRWQRGYALVALVSVAMFAPGPWNLWSLVRILPGFDFIRAPSRFAILMTLALSVLAGAGVDRLVAAWKPRAAVAGVALVGAVLLAEYATLPFSGVPFAMPRPAVVRRLAALPGEIVVAEVPIPRLGRQGAFERFETSAMLHSTTRWYRTIHGYSGALPPLHERLFRELNAFPDAISLDGLRAVGVTHIVVHRPEYPVEAWSAVDRQLRQTLGLRVVAEEHDGLILALSP